MPTNLEGLTWRVPQPAALGHNGTFNAFRVLKQDVVRLREISRSGRVRICSSTREVDELLPHGAEANIGQAWITVTSCRLARGRSPPTMCGRWRDGTPLALSADAPDPVSNVDHNEFRLRWREIPAVLTEPISAGAIRAADRSCNG